MVGRQVSHYRIVRRIDEGGMGEVSVAQDLELDREDCSRDARERIRIAAADGGCVLSRACSVSPRAPREHVETLVRAAVEAA